MGDGFFIVGKSAVKGARIACSLAFCHALAGLPCWNSQARQRGRIYFGAALAAGTKSENHLAGLMAESVHMNQAVGVLAKHSWKLERDWMKTVV